MLVSGQNVIFRAKGKLLFSGQIFSAPPVKCLPVRLCPRPCCPPNRPTQFTDFPMDCTTLLQNGNWILVEWISKQCSSNKAVVWPYTVSESQKSCHCPYKLCNVATVRNNNVRKYELTQPYGFTLGKLFQIIVSNAWSWKLRPETTRDNLKLQVLRHKRLLETATQKTMTSNKTLFEVCKAVFHRQKNRLR